MGTNNKYDREANFNDYQWRLWDVKWRPINAKHSEKSAKLDEELDAGKITQAQWEKREKANGTAWSKAEISLYKKILKTKGPKVSYEKKERSWHEKAKGYVKAVAHKAGLKPKADKRPMKKAKRRKASRRKVHRR
jgi:hypothetical protein